MCGALRGGEMNTWEPRMVVSRVEPGKRFGWQIMEPAFFQLGDLKPGVSSEPLVDCLAGTRAEAWPGAF